ncbi:PDR ABC-type transporter family protein [Tanacetum coccineum]
MARGARRGITGRGLLAYARPTIADESLTDPTSNGDMPRGSGGITRRLGLSYAPHGTTNVILDDLTSNGDEIVTDSTSNGNGNGTSRENVVVTNSVSRSTIKSSQNLSLTEGRKELSVPSKFKSMLTSNNKDFKERIDDGAFTWRKGDGPSTHTGGSVSYREYARKLETTLKRPPNPFELFVYTHTKNHDKETFIDKKAKTINDNVLQLREAREANHAEAESSQMVNESALYYEAVGGVKKRNMYGLGSQAFAYYPNPANRTSAPYMPHEPLENKYLKMERKLTRKIGKQQQILELLCSHLNIPVPSTESDTEDNNEANTVGGTQNPSTSNSEEHEV